MSGILLYLHLHYQARAQAKRKWSKKCTPVKKSKHMQRSEFPPGNLKRKEVLGKNKNSFNQLFKHY